MRDLFLLDPSVVFLNHGSFGACPRPVFECYQAWQRELEQQPVEFLGRRGESLYTEARDALAAYLGTQGDNLIFVPNATAGINTAARSLRFEPGDEILTTNQEYGALEQMWRYIQREQGVQIIHQTLPLPATDAAGMVEALWQGVTERTRVIYLSHITSPTALILPVQEVCRRAREAGILTIVDGAHASGQIPLNLDDLGADFYGGNCHKWLNSPKGAGFLYVRPEHHDVIDPLVISHGWSSDTLFERTSWQGTRDIAAYLSVPEAIRFQQEHDWDSVRTRCHDLAIDTMQRICDLSGQAPIAAPEFFAQMVTAPLPDVDAEALKQRVYDDYRVEVPIFAHHERVFVRVSIQGYNTRADADALVDALAHCLNGTTGHADE